MPGKKITNMGTKKPPKQQKNKRRHVAVIKGRKKIIKKITSIRNIIGKIPMDDETMGEKIKMDMGAKKPPK